MGMRNKTSGSVAANNNISRQSQPRAVEIFAGIGGLALGASLAGFRHDAVIERDAEACETIRHNKNRGVLHLKDWPLFETRVEDFDLSTIEEGLDLLCGGPPCQPFSLAGKSLGNKDARDMFPQAIRAVRELRPKAFAFENVNGFLRPDHLAYAEYVRLQLSCPQVEVKKNESFDDHYRRLELCFTGGKVKDERYHVMIHPVNAADFGVPQKRLRIFIVGIRADLETEWAFPTPTHTRDELLRSKFISGSYWDEHEVSRKKRETISENVRTRLDRGGENIKGVKRWVTVRDAIRNLPEPSRSRNAGIVNHHFVSGARAYPGHTGSDLDLPAKTLKAGVHGVPGGENMLRHANGKVRYFSVREKARLQTFDDDFEILGCWSSTTRQLGNAVPVVLGAVVAKSLREILNADS